MAIKVRRGGVMSRYWYGDEYTAALDDAGQDGLTINFSIPSKGGGWTSVRVTIDPSSFKDLALKMYRASPSKAKKAFDAAFQAKN